MKLKSQIYFIAAAFLIHSCKKDTAVISSKVTNYNSTTSVSYLPLTVGNYWVYQVYNVDASGNETYRNETDSIYIKKDSIIAGRKYYYFATSDSSTMVTGLFPLQGWVYDSAGFIKPFGQISWDNKIIFDPVHLNDTIQIDTATWRVVDYKIPKVFSNVAVPRGVYSGIMMDTKIRYLDPSPHSCPDSPTYIDFVSGIGICYFKAGWVAQPVSGYSWKLLRYHI